MVFTIIHCLCHLDSLLSIINFRNNSCRILAGAFLWGTHKKTKSTGHVIYFVRAASLVEMCSTKIHMLKSQPPVPQTLTLLRDKDFKDVIKLRWGPNPIYLVPL